MREAVERALDHLRSRLRMDGGDIELVEITPEGVVRVKLTGACQGCPMSVFTLKMVIEGEIRRALPHIKSVEAV